MNDLDDLRDALHAPPGFAAGALDLAAIMRDGGRLRRRRRLAAGSAAAVAGVALLVGGNQLIAPDNPSPRTGTAQVPAAPVSASPGLTDDALGDVIRTGLSARKGEWVLYATAIADAAIPETTFGVMLGVRRPNGELVPGIVTNETEGPDKAPGFHGIEGSMTVDAGRSPAFGYFVGPATKITVRSSGGKILTARQAAWSEDPSVVIFWIDPAKVPEGALLRNATAYDRNGRKLTAGHTSFGVG